MNHSNSFILSGGEYTGNFNKNNEKIEMLKFDLETTKDTIIKLKSELLNKNKEISNLKSNKDDKSLEHLFTLKLIATVLKLVDKDNTTEEQKSENENNNNNNSNNNEKIEEKNNNGGNNDNGNKNNENENKKEIKEENENNINSNSNNNTKKLPPISNRSGQSQSPSKDNNKANKELLYINSLKLQINGLKELLNKKDEEIKEIKKNKTTLNYSKLQNNFEKNIAELTKFKKENELMKTKIEDVTNLLFLEKEGNKSLKSKLIVFQSSFKDFQENEDKKNMDLEARLVQAQEKERDCKIFHVRKASGPEYMGSRSSSRVNLDKDMTDNERLEEADKQIKNMKKEIEEFKNKIEDLKKNNETFKESKNESQKKVDELKEKNNIKKNEINNLNKKVKDLKNTQFNLDKENKINKNKLKTSTKNLKNEENKTNKIKETLNKKENEIIELKNQIEKLKQNNNFKDGMFFTSIGAKGKTKDEKVDDTEISIGKELAEIEQKYKMINEENAIKEEDKKEDESVNKKEENVDKVENNDKNN